MVRSDLSAQCSDWLQVSLRTPFHPPAWSGTYPCSFWSCWEQTLLFVQESFCSPALSMMLTGGVPGSRIWRKHLFLASLSWGCRRKWVESDNLASSQCGLQVWKWAVETLVISNVVPPGHSLGGVEAIQQVSGTGFALNLPWALQAKASVFQAGRSECDSRGEMREQREQRALHGGNTLEGRAG